MIFLIASQQFLLFHCSPLLLCMMHHSLCFCSLAEGVDVYSVWHYDQSCHKCSSAYPRAVCTYISVQCIKYLQSFLVTQSLVVVAISPFPCCYHLILNSSLTCDLGSAFFLLWCPWTVIVVWIRVCTITVAGLKI